MENELKNEKLTVRAKQYAAFKELGSLARSEYSSDEKAAEGSKSGSLFVCSAITNPSKILTRVSKGKPDVVSNPVIGYTMVSTEDIIIPRIMEDVRCPARFVKAGDGFQVNLEECGELVTRMEYSGVVTDYNWAEGDPISICVRIERDSGEPRVSLVHRGENAVIEPCEAAIECSSGAWAVKPEFAEKFAYLFAPKEVSDTKKFEVENDARILAAAFRRHMG